MKYIAKQGIDIPKVLQKQIALVALLRFYVRIIASKMLFWRFFISKKHSMFNEMRALTSRKYVVEQGMKVLKSSEKRKLLWSHFSVFTLQ